MNKITVIQLLNKIANGEEVPKKIRFDTTYWNRIYGEKYTYYINDNGDDLFIYFFRKNLTFTLNDEVEIIEEEKKLPEKIKSNGKEFYSDNIDSWIDKEETSAYCEYLMNKYNDLIDYLESKEKGE